MNEIHCCFNRIKGSRMMLPTRGREPAPPRAIDIASKPTDAWLATWVGGIMLPVVLVGYGVTSTVARNAIIPNLRYYGHLDPLGKSPWIDFAGREGVLLGLASIFLGLSIHFHWFWSRHPKLVYFYDPLRYAAAAAAIAMLVGFSVSLMIF